MAVTELATTNGKAAIMERVVALGDLEKLEPEQRVAYYLDTCESLGLNPRTRPFEYLRLSGRLVLYARKDATDQLRKLHAVSVSIAGTQRIEDVYIVTARATMRDGRSDESTGAVTIGSLKGDALANALMKAETKAKRRVTLSICGLGMLDETEVETVRDAPVVAVNHDTGVIEPDAAMEARGRETIPAKVKPEPTKEQVIILADGREVDLSRQNRTELVGTWLALLAEAKSRGLGNIDAPTTQHSDDEARALIVRLCKRVEADRRAAF